MSDAEWKQRNEEIQRTLDNIGNILEKISDVNAKANPMDGTNARITDDISSLLTNLNHHLMAL